MATRADGVLYKATPDDLRIKAGDIDTTSAHVQTELNELKNWVYGHLDWEGPAALAFQELMRDWDTQANRLQVALHAIAEGLRGNSATYSESEHANLTNLRKVGLESAKLD